MGSTAAVTEPGFLLRHLAAGSRGALRAAPAVPPIASIENTLRALANLAQLQNNGLNPDNNASGSIAVHDPLAAKAFPNLLKLPGLFGDIKLTTPKPRS
jgi:hypothetical protein